MRIHWMHAHVRTDSNEMLHMLEVQKEENMQAEKDAIANAARKKHREAQEAEVAAAKLRNSSKKISPGRVGKGKEPGANRRRSKCVCHVCNRCHAHAHATDASVAVAHLQFAVCASVLHMHVCCACVWMCLVVAPGERTVHISRCSHAVCARSPVDRA